MVEYVSDEQALLNYKQYCNKALRARTRKSYYYWEDKAWIWRSILNRNSLLTEELKGLYSQVVVRGETEGFVLVLK